ncbi:MAG: ATP synthase F0, C subunit [uncultured bacterium]|nr:MAG: ATP synthase F0, C subunit [uncultured bacterium]
MAGFAEYFHFGTIALTAAINAIGVGIGQGITSKNAIESMNQQPAAADEIRNTAIMGMALSETASIMGTFISILLLLQTRAVANSYYSSLAEIGIAFAICCTGLVLGLVSALPARAACMAVARQPFFSREITRFMMIVLSLLQTPIIFGFIVALFIQSQAGLVTTMRDALRLVASGMCIGLGSIGPAIGLSLFAEKACQGIGKNRDAYGSVFSFTLISQAIIETPIIFSLIVSISLLFLVPELEQEDLLNGITLLAAGLCTGIGTFGPGISSGKTATAAVEQIAINPELQATLSRVTIFSQGLIESSAIYAVLISFILLFWL